MKVWNFILTLLVLFNLFISYLLIKQDLQIINIVNNNAAVLGKHLTESQPTY